ncbi:hypothetical protein G647_09226 [Cladophialophora carrionii CBS 160.54]|uniref:Uncharacterized protein n=1 Tax=Cladophialophora carrionii CBS 160.54 TaxID=1279043 RepID=V9CZF7_9EURO|nr:uncharacterized protein G647_09226 [Cladophialophora carrionii CBS 160.54]ETI19393.1 hypothetical protein G647_09226 [Cladophialophora carrionii CBS 160.54]
MLFPESGLAKEMIQEAYNARATQLTPWSDESLPVSDTARYSTYLVFKREHNVQVRRTIARSWIFLEAFEWCYGRKDMADNTPVLLEAMKYVESLPAEGQFKSHIEYQTKVFRNWPATLRRKLPDMPEKPRARFVWHLRLSMPGWYSWDSGRSDAFTRWLLNDTKFPPNAVLK